MLFDVKGMTCGHCVRTVTEAIERVDPAAKIEVRLDTGQVLVDSEAHAQSLADAIRAEGYDVQQKAA